MVDSNSGENRIDELAEEFSIRLRNGQRPSISEYVTKYPELESEIRELFPALEIMEECKPSPEEDRQFLGDRAAGPSVVDKKLGEYRIVREIGRGGMGVVYEAYHEALGRNVALKLLPYHTVRDERLVRRFYREAQAAARLHHTNIVPIYGFGDADGVPFFVMQLINGIALSDVVYELRRLRQDAQHSPSQSRQAPSRFAAPSAIDLAKSLCEMEFSKSDARGHPLSPSDPQDVPDAEDAHDSGRATGATRDKSEDESSSDITGSGLESYKEFSSGTTSGVYWRSIAQVGRQVADALGHAHSEGTLHRDIKPSNLLVDHTGSVWVTDFGLAKADDSEDLTQTGDVVGTVRYMAPERFRGQCDARSDVYSLGLTLYELLVLQPAFDRSDRHELIHAVTNEAPRPLSRIDPAIPKDLRIVVQRAIEREPDLRYPSASELADDLQRFLNDLPIKARRTSGTERMWRWSKRNPVSATLTLAISALLLSAAIVSAIAAAGFERVAKSERMANTEAKRAAQRADTLAQERTDSLVDTHVMTGARLVASNIPSTALLYFSEALRLDGDPERERLHRIRCGSALQACPKPEIVWKIGMNALHLSVSPDSRLVLTFGHDSIASREVRVWEISSGKLVAKITHEKNVNDATFSPDGQTVATASDDKTARIWNAKTGEPVSPALAHAIQVKGVSFGPHGRQLISTEGTRLEQYSDGASAKVWSVPGGEMLYALPHERNVIDAKFSPDGRLIATASADDKVRLWNAENGTMIDQPIHHAQNHLRNVGFLHDGTRLIASGLRRSRIWNTVSRESLSEALQIGVLFDLNLEGNLAISASGLHSRYFWLWDPEDAANRFPLEHENFVRNRTASFSPNGRLIVTVGGGDKIAKVWDARSRELALPPIVHTTGVLDAEFTNDSRKLVTLDKGGLIRVWDLATAQQPSRVLYRHVENTRIFSSTTGRLVCLTADSTTAQVWDLQDEARVCAEIDTQLNNAGAGFSPDERLLNIGGRDNNRKHQIDVWDIREGKRTLHIDSDGTINDASFSPDSRYLAVASRDKTVRIWDTRTGQLVAKTLVHDYSVSCVNFGPDSNRIVTGAGSRIQFPTFPYEAPSVSLPGAARVWEVATGQPVTPNMPHDQPVSSAVFSPDGRRIVTSTDSGLLVPSTTQIWDARSGQRLSTPINHVGRSLSLFDGEGSRIITVDPSGYRVWNADTGTLLFPPIRIQGDMWLSQDRRLMFLSEHRAGTSQIWDVLRGQPLAGPVKQQPGPVTFITAIDDGKKVVTADRFGELRLWTVPVAQGPVDSLVMIAQLVSGVRIHPLGHQMELTSEEYYSHWKAIAQQSPESLRPTSEQLTSWHARMAEGSSGSQE